MTVTVREVSSATMEGLISSVPSITLDTKPIYSQFIRSSFAIWVGTDEDRILCFYGLIAPSLLSDQAYLWMHTTDALKEHTFVLIRHSQRAVKDMLRSFPVITGHGTVGADRSLAWLRFLGAKFGTPSGGLIPFEIRSE